MDSPEEDWSDFESSPNIVMQMRSSNGGSRKRARTGEESRPATAVHSPYFFKPAEVSGMASQASKPRPRPVVTLKPGRRRARVSERVIECVAEAGLNSAGDQKSLAKIMESCLKEPGLQGRSLTGTFSSRLKEEHQCSEMDVDAKLFGRRESESCEDGRSSGGGCGVEERVGLEDIPGGLPDLVLKSNVNSKPSSRRRKQKGLPTEKEGDEKSNFEPSRKVVNIEGVLERLQGAASQGQIVHIEHLPERPATYGEIDYNLSPKLLKTLKERGIPKLYSHQASAVNTIFGGSSVVAATPTASGKSMMYIVPVLDALINDPNSKALLLFPMKALAHDQLKTLSELVSKVKRGQPHCYCFDGDTPLEDREKIRKNGRIILTNPDMIHHNLLPKHTYWQRFFSNLKFVVVDEAHTYRGVFGSHVGCILRRLLRIARYYRAEPMFICCSATIGNPKDHVKQLTTVDVEAIHGTGAPVGDRHIVCWQPPEANSPYSESADVAVQLLKSGLQMLVFVEARKLAESVCGAIRQKLVSEKLYDLAKKVDSYRAGYTAEDRRELEKRLRDGSLKALVTTRALELGIDVGHLDATVHVGLPDTVCSLWQQIGRSGRRQEASLAVVVGLQRPSDWFYLHNPEKLFGRDIEKAYCNPANPQLLQMHLCCAASELPLTEEDKQYFGEEYSECRDSLAIEGVLISDSGQQYSYRLGDNPSMKCPIRGTSMDIFQLVTQDGRIIEEMDRRWAFRRLHKGAIYSHQRDCYEIVDFNIEARRAVGMPCNVNYVTEVKEKHSVHILAEKDDSRMVGATRVHFGKLQVTEQLVEYIQIDLIKDYVLSHNGLNLPPSNFDTVGFWCDIPEDVRQKLEIGGMLYDALESVARVMRAFLPSLTMSEQADMSSFATEKHEGTSNPQIFMYDAYPGGMGLAKQAFDEFLEEIWSRALIVLEGCDCQHGCPCCIQCGRRDSVRVLNHNAKQGCTTLLKGLLGAWMSSEPRVSQEQSSEKTGSGNNQERRQKSSVAALLEEYLTM